MTKTRSFLFTAGIALATTFAISCTSAPPSDEDIARFVSEGGADSKSDGDGLPPPALIDPPPDKPWVNEGPDGSNPSQVPDAVDGSLDGAWQKGSAVLKISGRKVVISSEKFLTGDISYDKSSGSFWPEGQSSEVIIGFRYTLSGGVLTFSDVTGDIFQTLSGEWTEIPISEWTEIPIK